MRSLHLNLQGSKTDILSGEKLIKELDDSEIKKAEKVFDKIKKLDPHEQDNYKQISAILRGTKTFVSRFRRRLPNSVKNLSDKNHRLFRRLMTIYGYCRRTHLKKSAFTALRELPDLRILEKSLTYLSQLDYGTHNEIIDTLFNMLESQQLPFPYQIGSVLETISILHPQDADKIASRAMQYGLSKKQHWFVSQKALEVIFAYPYRPKNAEKLANKYLTNDHPMVRRAACVLLLKGSKSYVIKKLKELIYHPDHNLGRLALYFSRLLTDTQFAEQELLRISKSHRTDLSLQRNLPTIYAIAATEDNEVARKTYNYLQKKYKTKSAKLKWHKDILLKNLKDTIGEN